MLNRLDLLKMIQQQPIKQASGLTNMIVKQHIPKIKVTPNTLALQINKDSLVYVYSLITVPEVQDGNRVLIGELITLSRPVLAQKYKIKQVFYSGKVIWTLQNSQETISFQITNERTQTEYTIIFELKKEINLLNLKSEYNEKNEYIIRQVLAVFVKNALQTLGYVGLDKLIRYYEKQTIIEFTDTNDPINQLDGYFTSIKNYLWNFSLVIDCESKYLSTYTVYKYIKTQQDNGVSQQKIISQIYNKVVYTIYGNNRRYRIFGIDFNLKPSSIMDNKNCEDITFEKYYKAEYDIDLKQPDQPLLTYKTKNDKIIYLIPELLYFTGGPPSSDEKYNTLQNISNDHKKAKYLPQDRIQRISALKQKLQPQLLQQNILLQNSEYIQAYQLNIDYVLNQSNKEILINKDDYKISAFNLNSSYSIKEWILIYCRNRFREDEITKFINNIIRSGKDTNLSLQTPYKVIEDNTNFKYWKEDLINAIKLRSPQLIVSLMYNKESQLYIALKQVCIEQYGIPHQNVTYKAIKNNNLSIYKKITQQIYVKLGNQLWIVPSIQEISNKIIVIGIDVYHKFNELKDSCIGMVAHFEKQCKTHYSETIILPKKTEINDCVAIFLKNAIQQYKQYHKKDILPETIIIYRDGVGDSQIEKLEQKELAALQEVIKNMYIQKEQPQFAFIQVNKRIPEKFFVFSSEIQQFQNCRPGTLVKIDSNKNIEFYLISQSTYNGTKIPTKYRVLFNQTKWQEELFWQFTYSQCYNYQNQAEPIKVPACIQYAHKLAYLIGDNNKLKVKDNLKNKLFYL